MVEQESVGVGQVAVCITRQHDGEAEILLQGETPGTGQGSLLTTTLGEGEHPAEAAWRLLKDSLGLESCLSFRKLAVIDLGVRGNNAVGPCHVFQTALEDDNTALDGPVAWASIKAAQAQLDSMALRTVVGRL